MVYNTKLYVLYFFITLVYCIVSLIFKIAFVFILFQLYALYCICVCFFLNNFYYVYVLVQ